MDRQQAAKRKHQKEAGDRARLEREVCKAYRRRRRDLRFVKMYPGGSGPEPYNGSRYEGPYKVSRSEMFHTLAQQFGIPISEVKKIVGVS